MQQNYIVNYQLASIIFASYYIIFAIDLFLLLLCK